MVRQDSAFRPFLLAAALMMLPVSRGAEPDSPAPEDLGRSVKLRILVDKVMQPQEGWVTKEWMIAATAEAGFNVFSPRRGHDRLEEVAEVTEWCRKHGIFHMPWMRGSLSAPTGDAAAGRRLVWGGGNEQPLWSPNSDEFWEWTTRYVVAYARLSAANPHLIGVFLDYENYAPGKQGNLYSLSYDDVIMRAFAARLKLTLPELPLDQRGAWLKKRDLHDRFRTFQVAHWRERCRTLRDMVDEYNPGFRFCIYPAPGTPFMVEAAYPEWATEEAPLILADASTYGRPSRFLPQTDALAANRVKLTRGIAVPTKAGIPYLYVGGIDPAVRGADPEFSGKNAVMISELADGYWVFYEGPSYTRKTHRDYWQWFTWANTAIADRRFEVQNEARTTPENWCLDVFQSKADRPNLVPPPVTGATVTFPTIRLRRENLMVLAAKAGQPVEVVLRNHPVARYESLLAWEVRDTAMNKLAGGTIPHDSAATVSFVPEQDGVYILGASAGSCSYSPVRANVPLGLFAADGVSLLYGADKLYFRVPTGVEQFTITAKGWASETARVDVHAPDGAVAATGQSAPGRATAEIAVNAVGKSGATWWLTVTKADRGTLEDNTVRLDPKLVPILSLRPEHVFRLRGAK